MKYKFLIGAILLSMLALEGCATSVKVQSVQMGDNELSCKELQAEMKKLDDSQAQVESKKGANGTNVAAAIAWLPGLAYTYYDAGQATDAINARRSHLVEIFQNKGCKITKAVASASTTDATDSTDAPKKSTKKKKAAPTPAPTVDE
jgi:outer membrane murein-binding lipoprotein Lpp